MSYGFADSNFYSKNKFEKLVYLVSFITRNDHDARSPELHIHHRESSVSFPLGKFHIIATVETRNISRLYTNSTAFFHRFEKNTELIHTFINRRLGTSSDVTE